MFFSLRLFSSMDPVIDKAPKVSNKKRHHNVKEPGPNRSKFSSNANDIEIESVGRLDYIDMVAESGNISPGESAGGAFYAKASSDVEVTPGKAMDQRQSAGFNSDELHGTMTSGFPRSLLIDEADSPDAGYRLELYDTESPIESFTTRRQTLSRLSDSDRKSVEGDSAR